MLSTQITRKEAIEINGGEVESGPVSRTVIFVPDQVLSILPLSLSDHVRVRYNLHMVQKPIKDFTV